MRQVTLREASHQDLEQRVKDFGADGARINEETGVDSTYE